MKHRIIESLIMEKYGTTAKRIYKMLEIRGPMEQKQVKIERKIKREKEEKQDKKKWEKNGKKMENK